MEYDFDEIIDRQGTNALNTDGFRDYIFDASESITFPCADNEFIRMWVADMEFATPPMVIEAMRKRLERRIFGYTMIFGSDYYEAFSGWTKYHYNWHFPKEHLMTSHGIIPALYELVEYICKADEKVLVMTPSYASFKNAADHNNIEMVSSYLKEDEGFYTMDFEDIEEKVKDDKLKLCILCNPHNPTGRVWTEEELTRFGNICFNNNVMVISDEIHCDLLRNNQVHTPLAKLFPGNNKIITCMAPSKTFNLAGLKFSNIIIPDDDIRNIWKTRHYSMENPLSIEAARAAYAEGYEWLSQLKNYLDENFKFTRQFFDKHLPEANFRISEATYLAWVDISAYLDPEEDYPHFFAEKAGVLLEGGRMFVSNSEGYIRLNIACPKSILEEGLKRICDSLTG